MFICREISDKKAGMPNNRLWRFTTLTRSGPETASLSGLPGSYDLDRDDALALWAYVALPTCDERVSPAWPRWRMQETSDDE